MAVTWSTSVIRQKSNAMRGDPVLGLAYWGKVPAVGLGVHDLAWTQKHLDLNLDLDEDLDSTCCPWVGCFHNLEQSRFIWAFKNTKNHWILKNLADDWNWRENHSQESTQAEQLQKTWRWLFWSCWAWGYLCEYLCSALLLLTGLLREMRWRHRWHHGTEVCLPLASFQLKN